MITAGLLRLGLPHRDACEYIHSTCVEITPVAISNVYVASPYYNLCRPCTMCSASRRWGGAGRAAGLYQLCRAWSAFSAAHAGVLIREGVREVNHAMASRAQAGGFPLLSRFVNDCLARGRISTREARASTGTNVP